MKINNNIDLCNIMIRIIKMNISNNIDIYNIIIKNEY